MKHTEFLQYIDEGNPADVALLREYVALANDIGMQPEKFDSALRWAKANGSRFGGDIARAKVSFLEHMAQEGVDTAHVSAIVDWHGVVMQHGLLTDLPEADAQPDTSNDAALAAELRKLRRDDPEAFWADPVFQDELTTINERLSALPGVEIPAAVVAAPVADPAGRLKEIRQLRRDDPHAYDSNRAMQNEELGLIAASLPATSDTAYATPSSGADNAEY